MPVRPLRIVPPNPEDGKPPEASPTFVSQYLAALLTRASYLISHEFFETVRAEGYTVLQWRVLACLFDTKSMSVGEVAELAVSTQPTISRVVDELEAMGLVVRSSNPTDRRVTQLALTPEGLAVATQLTDKARAHESAVLAAVGGPAARTLKRTLQHFIAIRRFKPDNVKTGSSLRRR